jgi:hypothetical protein
LGWDISFLSKKLGREHKIKSMPNYSTAGSYCFLSQCIQFESLESKHLMDYIHLDFDSVDGYEAAKKVAPLLNHEVKHWYDAHSTLWGMKLLTEIYSCRNDLAVAEKSGIGTPLDHFNKQMNLRDSIEFIKYPDYYTTRTPKANTSRPWSYQHSCGILFTKHGKPSDRHIFFTRFENKDGHLIARVPFSLCALLEASAVSQELNSKVILINQIENPASRKIETQKLFDNTFKELYDENLVEYSVVAHKVANAFSLVDAIESYNISSVLIRFLFNLPHEIIDKIVPEKLLMEMFSCFFEPYKSAIKYKDLGSLFSLLIDALYSQYQSKGVAVNINNVEKLTSEMFSSLLDLNVEDIYASSRKEISALIQLKSFGDYSDYIANTLNLGMKLHEELGLFGGFYINLDTAFLPDFILGDGIFVSKIDTKQDDFENRYFDLNGYYGHLRNFANACIV